MSLLSKMLVKVGLVERRRDGRVPAHGLEVFSRVGSEQVKLQVRDISPTGLFVVSKDHLERGGDALLTLERKRSSQHLCSQVQLRARVVRESEDGVGLSFGRDRADDNLWLHLMGEAASLTWSEDSIERFRIAKALLFLAHLSPSVHSEISEMMSSSLDRQRRQKLVTLVIDAEQRLEDWDQPLRTDVSPLLIRQILQEGSKAEDPVTEAAWTLLLATSCLAGTDDEESLQFADLLSQLLPIDLIMFAAACERTMGVVRSASMEFYCSAEEMREIAHTPNLVAIEQHLHHLFDLGLLGRTVKPLKGEQIRQANMTATPLALQLYARCFEPTPSLSLAACG